MTTFPHRHNLEYTHFRREGDAKVLVLGSQQKLRIQLGLLSSWRVRMAGEEVILKGLKTRALVLLLLMSGDRVHARREIAAMLWPGQEEPKARASLRQALSELRRVNTQAGSGIIATTSDTIQLAHVRVETDFDTLETAILNGTWADGELDAVPRVSEIAADLFGISEAFDDWLTMLRQAQTRRLTKAMNAASTNTVLPAQKRLECAKCAFLIDDLNETSVRAMMSCLAALNDNAAALSIYRDFHDHIDEELGAEPSLETQDLAVAIKMANVAPGQPAPSATPVGVAQPRLTLVAVLPFTRLGPDSVPDYLPLGMLDQITCRLASMRSPSVISSNSTRRFLDQAPGLGQVRDATGARYVVTGSLQVVGDQGALAVQIADSEDDRIVWGTSIKVPTTRLFEISLDLADEIAAAIEPSLNVAELERSHRMQPDELEPHHLVLQAKDMMFTLRKADFLRAKLVLDEALKRGPQFAAGHALMAEWHTICLLQRWSGAPETAKLALEEHSRRAIGLAPGNGRMLAMWGHNKIAIDRDYDGAIRLFEKALRLFPNDAETLIWTVPTLALSNHEDEALGNGYKSFELSPADPFLFRNEHFLSLAHYAKGNFGEAARLGLSCYRRAPDYTSNLRATIAALVAAGQPIEARSLARHHNVIEPDFSGTAFRKLHGFRDPNRRNTFVDRLLDAGVAP